MSLLDCEPDDSVALAVPKSAKRVRGGDIAKTAARRATEAERWRYGVELRITGSPWRRQTRAPHYPEVKPYVYRPQTHSLAWVESDHNHDIDDDYRAWLAKRDAQRNKMMPEPTKPEPTKPEPTKPETVVAFARPAREAGQRSPADTRLALAIELLRDIAPQYGPRRAHKLQAMADWLATTASAPVTRRAAQ